MFKILVHYGTCISINCPTKAFFILLTKYRREKLLSKLTSSGSTENKVKCHNLIGDSVWNLSRQIFLNFFFFSFLVSSSYKDILLLFSLMGNLVWHNESIEGGGMRRPN